MSRKTNYIALPWTVKFHFALQIPWPPLTLPACAGRYSLVLPSNVGVYIRTLLEPDWPICSKKCCLEGFNDLKYKIFCLTKNNFISELSLFRTNYSTRGSCKDDPSTAGIPECHVRGIDRHFFQYSLNRLLERRYRIKWYNISHTAPLHSRYM